MVLFVGCLVFALVCYNKRKGGRGGRGDNGAGGDGVGMALLDGSGAPSSKLTPLPVDLERIVARGRFGAVWKGRVLPGGSEAQHAAAGEPPSYSILCPKLASCTERGKHRRMCSVSRAPALVPGATNGSG